MARAVLITGGNIGDTASLMGRAARLISEHGCVITGLSAVHTSKPWGDGKGEDDSPAQVFLNQVVEVETALDPFALLNATQEIERELGRNKDKSAQGAARSYASRTMDIDILFYGDLVLRSEVLTIPHPLLHEREFVLGPLTEVLPNLRHPICGLSSAEMLGRLHDSKKKDYE